MPAGTSYVIMLATGAIDCDGTLREYHVFPSAAFITPTAALTELNAPGGMEASWGFQSSPCSPDRFQPFSTAGVSVCMGDATTKTVALTVSPTSWSAAMKASAGQKHGDDF